MLFSKHPLYKNPKAEVVPIKSYNLIDHEEVFSGYNLRPKDNVYFSSENDELVGSRNIIGPILDNPDYYFFDYQHVTEYKDVLIFALACQPCNKKFFNKSSYRVRNVLIDRTFNLLIIFDDINEITKYLSGNKYEYKFGMVLNPYVNISLCQTRRIKNVNFPINKEKAEKSNMYECNLFENDQNDCFKNGTKTHFDNNIKVNNIYKFSSSHSNKMKIFKETIEHVVGYRIIHNK